MIATVCSNDSRTCRFGVSDVRLQDWSSFYDSSSQPPRRPAYTALWGRQKTAVFRKEERPELGWPCCSFVRYRLCLHLGQVGSITFIHGCFDVQAKVLLAGR